MQNSEVKVLISSHHPLYYSGYAKIAKGISDSLRQDGMNVRHVDIAGMEVKSDDKNFDVHVYSEKNTYHDTRGKGAFTQAINDFKPDILITVGDVWDHYHVPPIVRKQSTIWLAYVPVEQAPILKKIKVPMIKDLEGKYLNVDKYLVEPDYIVAYNKFGTKELNKVIKDNNIRHIHHGYDSDTYKIRDNISKTHTMGVGGINEDELFLAATVCRNNERKGIDLMLLGWNKFLKKIGHTERRKVRLYLHIPDEETGFDLDAMASLIGCKDSLLRNKKITYKDGIPDNNLANILNTIDIYLNTSRAEGFGIPIIESMGCGASSLVTDYAGPKCIADSVADKEICNTIKTAHKTINKASTAYWMDIDTDHFANQLADKYYSFKNSKLKDRQKLRSKASKKAEELYSWKRIGAEWSKLVQTIAEEGQRKIRMIKI